MTASDTLSFFRACGRVRATIGCYAMATIPACLLWRCQSALECFSALAMFLDSLSRNRAAETACGGRYECIGCYS
jgi:hypothetical protein